jgi:hypothetical protein
MAAGFISEYFTPGKLKRYGHVQKFYDAWRKTIPATLLSFSASHHHPPG